HALGPRCGVFAAGEGRAFARVARCLAPAGGHLVGAERRRLVHRDAAELERPGRAERALDVGREDSGLEAVARRVRQLDRLVEGRVGLEGAYRPEGLVAREMRVCGRILDNGGPDELAVERAAGEDPRTTPARLVDPREPPLALARADQRADVGLLLGGIADDERLHTRQERVAEPVVDGLLAEEPLDGVAPLSPPRERD